MKMNVLGAGMACVVMLAAAVPADAGGLEYSITPFLWGSALNGTIGLGAVEGTIDVSFSDLASNLDMAVPIHFEARGPVWTLLAEVNFVSLSSDLATGAGTGGVDMLTAELMSGWQWTDSVELLFGTRYTDLDSELVLRGIPRLPSRKFSASQSWIDPVVGIRYAGPISRKWEFSLRFDVGGFGLGSDFTWNLRTAFTVNVSDVTAIALGWHSYDVDYERNDFVYDMLQQGPEMGVRFKF